MNNVWSTSTGRDDWSAGKGDGSRCQRDATRPNIGHTVTPGRFLSGHDGRRRRRYLVKKWTCRSLIANRTVTHTHTSVCVHVTDTAIRTRQSICVVRVTLLIVTREFGELAVRPLLGRSWSTRQRPRFTVGFHYQVPARGVFGVPLCRAKPRPLSHHDRSGQEKWHGITFGGRRGNYCSSFFVFTRNCQLLFFPPVVAVVFQSFVAYGQRLFFTIFYP